MMRLNSVCSYFVCDQLALIQNSVQILLLPFFCEHTCYKMLL